MVTILFILVCPPALLFFLRCLTVSTMSGQMSKASGASPAGGILVFAALPFEMTRAAEGCPLCAKKLLPETDRPDSSLC